MARRSAGIKIDIGANVATLTTDIQKAIKTLRGLEKNTQSVGTAMKLALGGISLAGTIITVQKFSQSVLALAEAGDEASGVQEAFEKLGGSSSALDSAITRTQGLIEKFDLMKIANEGLIKGIPGLNDRLAELADLAARISDAKGLNPTEVFGELISALSSGKAKALEKFGFDLSKAKGEAQNTGLALSQLTDVLNRFDPVSLGAGDALSVFKNALETTQKEIGLGVNSSEQLTKALLGLGTAANSTNLQEFGRSLGEIEAVLINLAARVLPVATSSLSRFAAGIDYFFQLSQDSKLAKWGIEIDDFKEKLKTAQEDLAKAESNPGGSLFSFGSEWISPNLKNNALERISAYQTQIAQRQKLIDDEMTKRQNERQAQASQREKQLLADQEQAIKNLAGLREKYGLDSTGQTFIGGDSGGSAKKAAQELEKRLKLTGDNLRTNIENAIQSVNPEAFTYFKEQLFENTRQAYIEANRELVDSRTVSEEELGDLARAEAEKTVQSYESQMRDAQDRLAQQMQQAHEEAVGSWTNVFERLFNGGDFDATAAAKELATGFLSELMAGLVGGLSENAQSFYGIGRIIAQGLTDSAGSNFSSMNTGGGGGQVTGSQSSGAGWGAIFSGIGGLFGSSSSGMSFSGTAQTAAQNAEWNAAATQAGGGLSGGAEGASGAGSWAGYAAAGLQVIGAAAGAKGNDKASDSNAGTGAAIGAGIGAAIGSIFGPIGAMIGAQIGQIGGAMIGGLFKWGPQNPETQARHAFANFVEEGFQKLERISFFDANGIVRSFNSDRFNFREGDQGRFNPNSDIGGTDWGQNFQAMGQDVVSVFDGLGQAMEEMLGLTEDVGGQIGYLLATNFAGNIDNARLLVAQLGLSLEDMTEALIEAGRTGEMSWLEVEVALQGVNQAFGEGLVAVGDVAGAFNEFIGSAGRGIAAIKGVRDLAIESIERGGRSLEDLKNQLLQSGASPEVVDALINSIRGRGINSLEELRNANERVLGGIVADTNSSSQQLKDEWAQVEARIDSIKDTLDGIADDMVKNLKIKVTTEFDEQTKTAINNGVFNQTPVEPVGDIPIENPKSTRASYRPTVPNTSDAVRASGITLNIDARGAERGVHNDLVNSMAIMEKRIMSRTFDLVQAQISRGAM